MSFHFGVNLVEKTLDFKDSIMIERIKHARALEEAANIDGLVDMESFFVLKNELDQN